MAAIPLSTLKFNAEGRAIQVQAVPTCPHGSLPPSRTLGDFTPCRCLMRELTGTSMALSR
jgi:hypothetical protein